MQKSGPNNNNNNNNNGNEDLREQLEARAVRLRLDAEQKLRDIRLESDRCSKTIQAMVMSSLENMNTELEIRKRIATEYAPVSLAEHQAVSEEAASLRILCTNLRDVLQQAQQQHSQQLNDIITKAQGYKSELAAEKARSKQLEEAKAKLEKMVIQLESPEEQQVRMRPLMEQLQREQEWREMMEPENAKLKGQVDEYREEVRRCTDAILNEKQRVHQLEADRAQLQTRVVTLSEQLQSIQAQNTATSSLITENEALNRAISSYQDEIRKYKEELGNERERRRVAETECATMELTSHQKQEALTRTIEELRHSEQRSEGRSDLMEQIQDIMAELLAVKKERNALKQQLTTVRETTTPVKVVHREEIVGVAGIGLVLDDACDDGRGYRVCMVANNSSAADDGFIAEGDLIVAVDHVPVRGKTLSQVRDCIKGPIGSKVAISLERQGQSDQLATVVLTRGKDLAKITKTIIGSPSV